MPVRSKESSVSVPRRLPTASRMIPRASSHNYGSGSSYSSSNNTHEAKIVQQSAPVHILSWSKANGQKSNKGSHNSSRDDDDIDEDGDHDDEDEEEEEEEDDYNAKEPPHEFLARRLARSQISSFSVFEGAGRTLKGRDLSKVRSYTTFATTLTGSSRNQIKIATNIGLGLQVMIRQRDHASWIAEFACEKDFAWNQEMDFA
ncbi:hypothetical protein ACLB2K_029166 [Fragaria x ananassa]